MQNTQNYESLCHDQLCYCVNVIFSIPTYNNKLLLKIFNSQGFDYKIVSIIVNRIRHEMQT